MSSERVLIIGAGVAGSITAYWLAKYGFEVVVIERARAGQKLGQGVEIEEPALSVVEAMGVIDELEAKKTDEAGFELFDTKDRSWGRLDVGRFSPTGALELMRGDLTEVLYKKADESANVTYHFETVITDLKQTQDKVTVDLENRTTKTTSTEEFDFVIGADGAKSRTRNHFMDAMKNLNCLQPVGAFVAYFSIPKEARDWPYSRACQFPGRRLIWLRPISKESDSVSAYLTFVGENPALRQANGTSDRSEQKELLANLFSGLGWEAPRVMEGMMKAENFYSDELVQVKLSKWSQGRVTLVGDAAWAPTPFTGEGNQLAILGAFVLAQEMSRNRSLVGFEQYEKRFRPYVEECQKLPLNGYAPKIACPESAWGVWLFRITLYTISLIARFLIWMNLSSLLPDGEAHPPIDLQMEKNEKQSQK